MNTHQANNANKEIPKPVGLEIKLGDEVTQIFSDVAAYVENSVASCSSIVRMNGSHYLATMLFKEEQGKNHIGQN